MFVKTIFLLLTLSKVIPGIYEDEFCNQGDAYRRNCLVCLCSTKTNRWSCKNDICNDCEDEEMLRKDDSNFYCKNGRWTLLPFLQLPQFQHTSILPLGPCKNEMFKPDWPCNRCQCNQTENVWECPLELCREDTIIKDYSNKVHESRLDRVYEFFKYDGSKEVCREGEIRNEDACNRCVCKESTWWCKLKECPDVVEQDSIAADTLPEFLEIELPQGMQSIREQEGDEIIKICNPGSRYKKGCNTCNCSMDGTAETCTQNICDHMTNFQDEFLKNYYEEEDFENHLHSGSGSYNEYRNDYIYEGYNEDYKEDNENYNEYYSGDYNEDYVENYNNNEYYSADYNEDYVENYDKNEYLNTNYDEYEDESYYEYYEKHETEYFSGEYKLSETEEFQYEDLNDEEDVYDQSSEGYVDEDDDYYEYYDRLEHST